jgi:hypothetical protein
MSSNRRRTIVEHASDDQQRNQAEHREELIAERLETCSRALSRGLDTDYRAVAVELARTVVPKLREHTPIPLPQYDRRLAGRENWHWADLTEFIDHAPAYIAHFSRRTGSEVTTVASRSGRLVDSAQRADTVVRLALESLAAIAENEGIVMDDYAARVDVKCLNLKVGEHLQQESMDIGDPVHGMSFQLGSILNLHGGKPGSSKSAGTEAEAEPFYHYDPDDQPDELEDPPRTAFKLIHLVDLDKGEAWFYDIPQQQPFLRDLREEKGLEPDFAAAEDLDQPETEILVPLTDELDDFELPFDTDREAFTPRPFTIPACTIPKALLVKAILARVTNQGERAIRQAYDEVDRERDDWALTHLAENIRRQKELSDKNKSNAIGVLRSLQNEGYIRTKSDSYTVDWRDLFEATDTISVFSQASALCKSEFGQKFLVAMVLHRILHLRDAGGMFGLPEAVLIMPELWRVVPHNQRDAPDERVAAVQQFIASRMGKAGRLNRRMGIHILADTQYPYDLKNSVREMFNRYVIHNGTTKLAEGAFNWTGNSKYRSFYGSLTSKRGQAGVVGEVQPAIDERGIEYLSPVEYAPPSHHHFDKDVDQSGWHAREKYLTPTEACPECGHAELERSDDGYEVTCLAADCGETSVDLSLGRNEELRQPEWDTDVPERLGIDTYDESDGEDGDDEEETADAATLARHEARNRRRHGESLRQIRDNIKNNPDTGNPYSLSTIQKWTDDISPNPGGDAEAGAD